MNIVIVEDHHALRRITSNMLREDGHKVVELYCAEDVKNIVGNQQVDIFIIDLNLPGEGGLSLAKRMRLTYPLVGIIMVTARMGGDDIASGYSNGADIYLAKPVLPDVLLSAVHSLGRRIENERFDSALILTAFSLELSGPNAKVTLSAREAKLLVGFAQSIDQQLETGEVASLLGMGNDEFNKSALEVRMVRLRKKLKAADAEADIKSIRLIGYRLTPQLTIR